MTADAPPPASDMIGAPTPEPPVTADHEPVTWCRVLMVGLPCSHPCVDCKRADANYTDAERERLLAPYRAAIKEATCPS